MTSLRRGDYVMITQELMETVMRERMWEAAQLQRQQQAEALQEQDATPRVGLSRQRIRRLPLLSFMARGFRTASVS